MLKITVHCEMGRCFVYLCLVTLKEGGVAKLRNADLKVISRSGSFKLIQLQLGNWHLIQVLMTDKLKRDICV